MKDIDTLIQLQGIDFQIFKIKEELEEKPQEISTLEDEFKNHSSSLKNLENDLKQLQVKNKEKELDLESKEELVKKQQGQLYQLKSNKEYNALQLEIEKMKADNSLVEEDIIMSLEKIDKLKELKTKEQSKLLEQEKQFKQVRGEIEIRIKELNQQLDGFNAQRKRVIDSGIKPNILNLYERILENKRDLAIVPVKHDTCQGCFLAIRPQTVNELKLGSLITCENCARILYVEHEE